MSIPSTFVDQPPVRKQIASIDNVCQSFELGLSYATALKTGLRLLRFSLPWLETLINGP